ncbi:MAG: NAD-dependent epimerase/dehydratase family protein, partial [Patescibacteria group bacterium]
GPYERVESGYVIPSLIKKIIDAQKRNLDFIQIWGSGNSRRDFLYAEDAAEGVVRAAERYDKPEPVNLGSGGDIAIKDLVKKLCDAMGYRGEIRFDHAKPEGQLRRLLDVTKAEREFGFRATTGIDNGLARTIQWFRKAYIPKE